jgi:hypothetical protein
MLCFGNSYFHVADSCDCRLLSVGTTWRPASYPRVEMKERHANESMKANSSRKLEKKENE